jgi:uncharacterized protein
MTTLALSFHNAGITALSSTILSLALLYGGLAQVIVGIMEWKKNNTFGLLTFGSFGFFWISLATLMMLPATGLAKAPGPAELAVFLGLWGLFSLGIFICTLRMHLTLQLTLLALVITFILLVAAELTSNSMVLLAGGVIGIITGALAFYIGLGQVINEVFGKRMIPV